MLRRRRQRADDDGFTLVELLISITMLGIIGGAIVASFLVMLTTKKSTSDQLAANEDKQFLANFFTDDVADALTVSSGTQTVCGTSMSTLVTFTGRDYTPGTTTAVSSTVAWTYQAVDKRVTRIRCLTGGPTERRVLARDVPSAPVISTSCTATTAVVNGANPAPAQVAMTVPSTFGTTADLCGRRRAG